MIGFDAAAIRERLAACGLGNAGVSLHDTLDSTHTWLKSAITEGAARAPFVCATDWQQAGLATRGRHWQTPAGNLTFSLLHESPRSAPELMGLSLVTGIAIAQTLAQKCGVEALVKWPNDVLVEDHKIAGILMDVLPIPDTCTVHSAAAASIPRPQTRVLAGIGINMVHEDAHEELGMGATSLERHWSLQARECRHLAERQRPNEAHPGRPLRDRLLVDCVAAVLEAWQRFDAAGWAAFAEVWPDVDALRDRDVRLIARSAGDGKGDHWIARGVDAHGALKLERQLPDGSSLTEYVYSGEVSVRLGKPNRPG